MGDATIVAILAGVVALFLWLEARTRWRGFEFFPPLLWIYAIPVALNNAGVLPAEAPVYGAIGDVALPSLLVLMLISIDLPGTLRLLGRGIGVMLFASFGVVLGAAAAYGLTRSFLPPDGWKMFGALSGAWIGGSGNMLAVAHGVDLAPSGLSIAILADNVVFMAWLPMLIASKRYAEPFARWARVDTERVAKLDAAMKEAHRPPRPVETADVAYTLAAVAAVVAAADGLARLLPEAGAVLTTSTWRTLLVTTFAILLSFTPARRLPATREMGIALMYFFLASVGARATFSGLENAPAFIFACCLWITFHGAFCLLGARLLRVDIHTAAIASAANIGGPATAPVVAAHHRETLVPASILMALTGYAAGNYLAFLTAELCYRISLR